MYYGAGALVLLYIATHFEYIRTHLFTIAAIFTGIASIYPFVRLLEKTTCWNVRIPLLIGVFWMGVLPYLVIGTFLISLLSFWAEYLRPWIQLFTGKIGIYCMVLGLIPYMYFGWMTAQHPKVRKLNYTFKRWSGSRELLHIIAVTDVHLGNLIQKKHFDKLVKQIDGLKPDCVFFVGDTIDEDIDPVIRQDIGSSMRKLHAPFGVYAVNGNHEHIGWVERADAYLVAHGVTMLRDESIIIDDAITLVWREDVSVRLFGKPRKSLEVLLQNIRADLPVILLDHQPVKLTEVAKHWWISLQLSGHTHHGQMWPFSYFTRAIFEVSWWEKKILDTWFYVSSGWGTWWPPIRTGNTPEILDIKIRFE
jgi:uncharacterized protein